MTRSRLCAVVVVAVLAVVAGAGSAATGQVDRQAWAPATAVTTFQASEGAVYVAVTAGVEEARSFVHVDVTGSTDAELAEATLVVYEAEGSLLPENATVAACALTEPIPDDGRLEPADAPATDCSVRTLAERADDGSWTVELGVFVPGWTGGADFGLALIPDVPPPGATWRLALDTARTEVQGVSTPTTTTTTFEEEEDTSTTTTLPSATGFDGGGFDVGAVDSLLAPETPPPSASAPAPPAVDEVAEGEPIAQQRQGGSNAGFSAFVVLLVALLTAAAVVGGRTWRRALLPTPGDGSSAPAGFGRLGIVVVSAVALLPLLFREVIVYKAGVVLVYFVAAIGLHVLVNWTGQVSLAHAAMVGIPAFVVIAISEEHGISPLYLLPVGVVVGAALGGLLALPTLRAKDLQVALLTLVAGLSAAKFFFTQEWLIGPAGGRSASTPTLGPFEFTTSRSLYPVLLAIVALAVGATWVLMHSKIARGWYWVQADPAAAAAFGLPVVAWRIGAYAVGGAFAGLAGGLTVLWVQRLGAGAFPSSLSFTYLLIAVVAGAGFLGGVGAASFILVGGPMFASNIFGADVGETLETALAYLGPLGLIYILARRPAGLNGWGRKSMKRIGAAGPSKLGSRSGDLPSPAFVIGVVAIVVGFVAIGLAWRHSSRTNQLWVQNQEMLSGGVGGLGAIIVGVGLLIRDRLQRSHALLAAQLEALLGRSVPVDTNGSGELPVEPSGAGRRRSRTHG